LQKSICTRIVYAILSIEQYRDILLAKLVNLLQGTSLKVLNEGYLITQANRKNALKMWINDKFINNIKIACPVFKTRIYYWEKKEYLQYVLNFFTYLDSNLTKKIDKISLEDCQQQEQSILEQCCTCNQMGSITIKKCDYLGQCECREGYSGQKCNSCHDGNGYYRQDPDKVCQNCQCSAYGSIGKSCNNYGKCQCKPLFTGDKCDQCKHRYFLSQHEKTCKECNCYRNGITANSGGKCGNDGQCDCISGFTGKLCESCLDGYYGRNCVSCDCDETGSTGQPCHKENGQCTCNTGYQGLKCNDCEDAYYKDRSECKPCLCDQDGQSSEDCDKRTGKCICKPGFKGQKCDRMENGYYKIGSGSTSKAELCDCNSVGIINPHNGNCNDVGECNCKEGYTGKRCELCLGGYFLSGAKCNACNCDESGSKKETCDTGGTCDCKDGYKGPKCSSCETGYYKYGSKCRQCSCSQDGTTRCSPDGQCKCKPGFKEGICESLKNGYYKVGSGSDTLALPCQCHANGQSNGNCNRDGQCYCKDEYTGTKCHSCKPGYKQDNSAGKTICRSYYENELEGIIKNTIVDIGESYKSSSNQYVGDKIYDSLKEQDAMNQYYVTVIVYNDVAGFDRHWISGSVCTIWVFRKFGKNYAVFYRRKDSTSSTRSNVKICWGCGSRVAYGNGDPMDVRVVERKTKRTTQTKSGQIKHYADWTVNGC